MAATRHCERSEAIHGSAAARLPILPRLPLRIALRIEASKDFV